MNILGLFLLLPEPHFVKGKYDLMIAFNYELLEIGFVLREGGNKI